MKNTHRALLVGAIVSTLGLFSKPVHAIEYPSFSTCTSPSGTVKVSYPSGIHGIPGDSKEYKGKDTVYSVSDIATLQCFCAEDGAGIQTYWWKASSLKQEEIDILTKDRWVYIPNGSLWGLDDVNYLAKNQHYSCTNSSGGGGGSSSSSSSSSNSSSSSDSLRIGDVLGLADTGAIIALILSGVISILFLTLGIRMARNKKS